MIVVELIVFLKRSGVSDLQFLVVDDVVALYLSGTIHFVCSIPCIYSCRALNKKLIDCIIVFLYKSPKEILYFDTDKLI